MTSYRTHLNGTGSTTGADPAPGRVSPDPSTPSPDIDTVDRAFESLRGLRWPATARPPQLSRSPRMRSSNKKIWWIAAGSLALAGAAIAGTAYVSTYRATLRDAEGRELQATLQPDAEGNATATFEDGTQVQMRRVGTDGQMQVEVQMSGAVGGEQTVTVEPTTAAPATTPASPN